MKSTNAFMDFKEEHINAWKNYQKLPNNDVISRIKLFGLLRFAGKDKTMIDLGANMGHFGNLLSKDFKSITSLEPVVRPSDINHNVTWISEGLKSFSDSNIDQYDLVLSLAMTLQVKQFDEIDEAEIAEIHFNLTKKGGYLVYETQKLSGRPENKKHVSRMVREFRKLYHSEIESSAARKAGGRIYFIFRKTV